MTCALLFPGQAMARLDELASWIEESREDSRARRLVEHAARAAGVAPDRLRSDGGRLLSRTEVLQPLLVALSLARLAQLEAASAGELAQATVVAGHSLGELGACAASGRLTVEEAIDLAALRGRAMAQAAAEQPGGMLAVTAARDALPSLLAVGGVELAAVNAPDELVLAGSAAGLERVAARVPGRRLDVAGAWHGSSMRDAVEAVRRASVALPSRRARWPLVAQRDGRVCTVEELADPLALASLLAEQIARPVEWTAVLERLRALGIGTLVTVGPGRVLRSLARRTLGVAVEVLTTESAADVARTAARLRERSPRGRVVPS